MYTYNYYKKVFTFYKKNLQLYKKKFLDHTIIKKKFFCVHKNGSK